MNHRVKLLSLLLLLLVAQQGALVHEFSHFSKAGAVGQQVKAGAAADGACALCPAFAQVVTPAFSHKFTVPAQIRVSAELRTDLLFSLVRAPVPLSRSRGPPSLS
jgi:hypothetical protein